MDNSSEELARIAYDAYGQTTGHKNFQGNPMPAYDDLDPVRQNAWERAAEAVACALRPTVGP